MIKYYKRLLLLLVLFSCKSEKTYKYYESAGTSETGITYKDPITLKANSDSEAYLQAYTTFCISQSVSSEFSKNSNTKLNNPIPFKLINKDGVDIFLTINFAHKDSLEKEIESSIKSRVKELHNNAENSLSDVEKPDSSTYEILETNHNQAVENFHIFYKNSKTDKQSLQDFVNKFRQSFCTRKCNIFLYDSKAIKKLVTAYPLTDKEYLLLADHNTAQSLFDLTEIWLYPLQDIKYKELGGKNWKKKPVE